MARRGYDAEYRCKKENEKIFGIGNCLKIAIGGSSDFLIVSCGEIVSFIEVKETKKNKYYPNAREKLQFEEIKKLGRQHQVKVELWIYYKKGKGKKLIKQIQILYDPNEKKKS